MTALETNLGRGHETATTEPNTRHNDLRYELNHILRREQNQWEACVIREVHRHCENCLAPVRRRGGVPMTHGSCSPSTRRRSKSDDPHEDSGTPCFVSSSIRRSASSTALELAEDGQTRSLLRHRCIEVLLLRVVRSVGLRQARSTAPTSETAMTLATQRSEFICKIGHKSQCHAVAWS